MLAPRAPPPSAAALARRHAGGWAVLALLVAAVVWSDSIPPFVHAFNSANAQEELWRLSYPLAANQVPPWAVPAIATAAPLAAVGAARLTGHIGPLEAHHASLAALTCVAANGLATNLLKVAVGRWRPNFAARCWPGGAPPRLTPEGRPDCATDAVNPAEGMKSFPSGHTSWATAGLAFASLFLAGRLRAFGGGGGAPARLAAALAPLAGAAWVGASRVQDNWHHPTDVLGGAALGLTSAWLFYRSVYCPVMGPDAGALAGGGSGGGGGGGGGGEGKLAERPKRGAEGDDRV